MEARPSWLGVHAYQTELARSPPVGSGSPASIVPSTLRPSSDPLSPSRTVASAKLSFASGAMLPVQHDGAGHRRREIGVEAADLEVVGRAGFGRETDAALVAAARIVVARQLRQGREARARVDGEHRVEVAAERVEEEGAGRRRDPLPPDCLAVTTPPAYLGLLARLQGRVDVRSPDGTAACPRGLRVGPVVVRRRIR